VYAAAKQRSGALGAALESIENRVVVPATNTGVGKSVVKNIDMGIAALDKGLDAALSNKVVASSLHRGGDAVVETISRVQQQQNKVRESIMARRAAVEARRAAITAYVMEKTGHSEDTSLSELAKSIPRIGVNAAHRCAESARTAISQRIDSQAVGLRAFKDRQVERAGPFVSAVKDPRGTANKSKQRAVELADNTLRSVAAFADEVVEAYLPDDEAEMPGSEDENDSGTLDKENADPATVLSVVEKARQRTVSKTKRIASSVQGGVSLRFSETAERLDTAALPAVGMVVSFLVKAAEASLDTVDAADELVDLLVTQTSRKFAWELDSSKSAPVPEWKKDAVSVTEDSPPACRTIPHGDGSLSLVKIGWDRVQRRGRFVGWRFVKRLDNRASCVAALTALGSEACFQKIRGKAYGSLSSIEPYWLQLQQNSAVVDGLAVLHALVGQRVSNFCKGGVAWVLGEVAVFEADSVEAEADAAEVLDGSLQSAQTD